MPVLAAVAALSAPEGVRGQQIGLSPKSAVPWALPQPLRVQGGLLEEKASGGPFVALGLAAIARSVLLSLAGPGREARPRFGERGRALSAEEALALARGDLGAPPFRPRMSFAEAPGARRRSAGFSDLDFSVEASGSLGGEWARYRPCDAAVEPACAVRLLPKIRPDVSFSAIAAGTVLERLAVDVDYDQAREFQEANRVNIRYLGREEDLLRRVEVGDVRFSLPYSETLGEAIPAGNFGFGAELMAGPVQLQSVWAQQTGEINSRAFRLTASGAAYSGSDTLALDDADYASGQFFFLFDPAKLRGYPHIDALALTPSDAPLPELPGDAPIQLYRSETGLAARRQVEGYVQADAAAGEEGAEVEEAAWFRYLRAGEDYVVHPSGLWFALRVPLGSDEMLAVAYIAQTGDTVGTYNPERVHRAGERPKLRLLKASAGNHQPGRPTWRTEMRQVYRVSASSDIAPGSVRLSISLGDAEAGRAFARRRTGEDITYLRLFGLDEEAPRDELDVSQLYVPALEAFEDQPPVHGAFVVFPTLAPFAEPPPLPSLGIGEEEAREMLGQNRNEKMYRDADPYERRNNIVFRLRFSYELTGDRTASVFSLGAIGIREGSERVSLGDETLLADIDYVLDYDLGQLLLLDPEELLARAPDGMLRVTWEQRSRFQVAPVTVAGAGATVELGEYGAVHATLLRQTEDQLVRRPRLGLESGQVGLVGVGGTFEARAPLLTRLLNAIPGLDAGEESTVRVRAESAVSFPNPNRLGSVYVDDFDGSDATPLSLKSNDWRLGSRPASTLGARDALPPSMDPGSKAKIAWQHQWIVESLSGDSVGVFQGFHPPTEIDRRIRVDGGAYREPGLYLSFEPESGDVPGPRSWASVTAVLSPTGADLSQTDYIEFYARGGEFMTLVIDVGSVSEDAFFVNDAGATGGSKGGSGAPWGLGILDQEARPRLGEVWDRTKDEIGVWDERCFAKLGGVYRIGSPRANCTRGNGRPNSEDLDEDGVLDTRERVRRFVVRAGERSPFVVRGKEETGTEFVLYRIPIRGGLGVDVGGPITANDLRRVQHLRITLTGARRSSIVLARAKLVGSRWIRRAQTGVLTGLGGDTASYAGRVAAAPVSKVTAEGRYASPPGVIEELDDPALAYAGEGIEVAERALSLRYENVPPAGRAEVYHHFAQRPRDFLSYREARLWAVAPNGNLKEEDGSRLFLKAGADALNFYYFETSLDPPRGREHVAEEDWRPEIVVDFEEWLVLRQRAERLLIQQPRLPSDPPLILWSADSTYGLVLQDRGRAPNLAAVREIAFGVRNSGSFPESGEVWINELRLAKPIRNRGAATVVEAEANGGDFLSSRVSYRGRGGYFRRLRGAPTFQDQGAAAATATLEMGRFLPESWGLKLPVSFHYERDSETPIFLGRSDVRTGDLDGIRAPSYARTSARASIRRAAQPDDGALETILSGMSLGAGVDRSTLQTITTESSGEGFDLFASFSQLPKPRAVPLFPGAVGRALRRVLPAFLEERIAGARLRWNPERLSARSDFYRRGQRTLRFDRIARLSSDTLESPAQAPRSVLASSAGIALRPLESLSAEATIAVERDLLEANRQSSDPRARTLLLADRRTWLGRDIGWETDRSVRTRLAFHPDMGPWIRGSIDLRTAYLHDRRPDMLETKSQGGRDTLVLARNVNGQRDFSALLQVDPGALRSDSQGARRLLDRIGAYVDPLAFTYASGVTSRFDRDGVTPGTLHELGWVSRQDYWVIGEDTASTLSERNRLGLRGGLRFPGEGSIGVAYERSRAQALDTRSDRRARDRVWPDLGVAILNVPLPGAAGVRRLSLRTGFRRTVRAMSYGTRGSQDRTRTDDAVPMSASVAFEGGWSLSYSGAVARGEGMDPTGTTRTRSGVHGLSVSARLPSPFESFREEGGALNLSAEFGYSSEVRCRASGPGAPCVAFIDQLERRAEISLDSSVRRYRVGILASYVDRRSFVGLRPALTRFRLNVFGRLRLTPEALRQDPG